MKRCAPILVAIGLGGTVHAQDAGGQQGRLIEIHSLLLDLPPLQSPAALSAGTLDASVEAVTIPPIDGTVGDKQELTASDHTRVFPRPRFMLGLPAPLGARAFVGLSYIPPLRIRQVSTNYGAVEGGVGIAPGAFRLGPRLYAVYATSSAPVTEPQTRDLLKTWVYGADFSAGVRLGQGAFHLEPYAALGIVSLRGDFRVTVDGTALKSAYTGPALHAGLRLALGRPFEVVAETVAYPGRLIHTDLRVGYLFGG